MTIIEQFIRDGDRLFRWRSYFPLALVPVIVAGVVASPAVFSTPGAERSWEVFSVAVALAGLAMRVVAVGTAPAGTSERSTVNPRASELRSSGVYSIVRHPLYVANGLMALGIALFPGVWYLPPIVLLGSLLYYERIAAREERFLEEQFGPAFRTWADRVPALIPRASGWLPSSTPMSWRQVLRGEFHGLLTVTASVFVVDVVQVRVRSGAWAPDPVWAWTFLVTGLMFVVARTLKKTTRVLHT